METDNGGGKGESATGVFYGVGVGPGDPELLTLKALRVLQSVPAIYYPACAPGAKSYASKIIERYVRPDQMLTGLLFPMEKDMERLRPIWEESAATMAADLLAGRDVAFITEGDPFFYSTFVYMDRIIRRRYPQVAIEVIPAVASPMAAAARTGVPLAMVDERLAVLPATYDNGFLLRALEDFDTVVLLKVNSVMPKVMTLLEKLGLLDRAVFVERCGSPEERVVTDLRRLEGERLNYLSLVIVKKGAL